MECIERMLNAFDVLNMMDMLLRSIVESLDCCIALVIIAVIATIADHLCTLNTLMAVLGYCTD